MMGTLGNALKKDSNSGRTTFEREEGSRGIEHDYLAHFHIGVTGDREGYGRGAGGVGEGSAP